MELGSADEQKVTKPGTVEAWGRSPNNPVKGWYGRKKRLHGLPTIIHPDFVDYFRHLFPGE